MACEALQVVCVAQCSHELASQAFPALSANLASPLRLGCQLLVGIYSWLSGHIWAVLGKEAIGRVWFLFVCPPPREAIAAGIVGVWLRCTLAFHIRRAVCGCAHVQLGQSRERWPESTMGAGCGAVAEAKQRVTDNNRPVGVSAQERSGSPNN